MRPKTSILAAALIASLAAVIVAWRSAGVAASARTKHQSLVGESANVTAQLQRLERATAEATELRAQAEAALAAWQAQNTAADSRVVKPATEKVPVPAKGPAEPGELLAKDPKLQALSIEASRGRFETTYGPLLRSLRLSPAQIAKLGAAQGKFDALQQDMTIVMREQNLRANDAAILQLRQQAADELRTVQVEVLGAAGYEQLQSYERTLPVRAIAGRFAGAMAVADRPMSAQQAERLTQIMTEASGATPGNQRINPAAIDWSVVDRLAADVLSPDQLSLFKRIEPLGGGPSRWTAQFDRAIQEARKAMTPGK